MFSFCVHNFVRVRRYSGTGSKYSCKNKGLLADSSKLVGVAPLCHQHWIS